MGIIRKFKTLEQREEAAKEILRLYNDGCTKTQLKQQFGVSFNTITAYIELGRKINDRK